MTIAERRMERTVGSVAHVFDWFTGGDWERHHLDPGIAEFAFGNDLIRDAGDIVMGRVMDDVWRDPRWLRSAVGCRHG